MNSTSSTAVGCLSMWEQLRETHSPVVACGRAACGQLAFSRFKKLTINIAKSQVDIQYNYAGFSYYEWSAQGSSLFRSSTLHLTQSHAQTSSRCFLILLISRKVLPAFGVVRVRDFLYTTIRMHIHIYPHANKHTLTRTNHTHPRTHTHTLTQTKQTTTPATRKRHPPTQPLQPHPPTTFSPVRPHPPTHSPTHTHPYRHARPPVDTHTHRHKHTLSLKRLKTEHALASWTEVNWKSYS